MTIRSGLPVGLVLLLCVLFTGCITKPTLDTSRMSALQIRAIQTRTYETQDTKAALKTVLNVLQDEGFLVDYGDVQLGLLHGSKQVDALTVQSFGTAPAQLEHEWFYTANSFGELVDIVTIEATANVTGFGNSTKIRVNFQQKTANNWRGTFQAVTIIDAKYYQEFFAKLERGLFIQKEGL